MTEPILEIEDLNISFFVRAGEIPAVMDFSCTVMPGETMGLVGESGCGKSTVALGIMRDMGNRGKIVGGKIKFKGRDMGEMSDEELRDLRGSKIAMIYQEPMASLNPAMKIGKQLMEVPLIHEKVSKQEAYDRSLEMLESVKLPDPARIMEAYPHQVSGGQQQRVVIAMALLSKPDLLLLDEPTTALDVTVEAGIVELVKELGQKTGTSMLFISHNLGLILETCDKITVMYSGEAVETGSVHDVFDSMRHPYTQGLFNSIPLPGADKNSRPLIAIPGQLPLPMERPRGCNFGPRCDHYVEEICNAAAVTMQSVEGMPNHQSRCKRIADIDWFAEPERNVVSEPTKPGKVVLDIKNLKKYYDVAANKIFGGGDTRTVKANETITFQAREAETVAIVGESGCGKSTLAKVLLGLETATEGEVLLDDRDIGSIEVNDRNKRTVASVQMVFQNPFDTLNPSHTVGSQIMRTLDKFGIGESDAARRQYMLELLDLVKLPRAFAERMPRQLSGGQKQRIGVARAFAGQPRVVVADEPVSALDVSVQAAVTELLMDIQREARTTMLFISHDLSIVRYIADRVVVMYLGHIVEQGTTDAIFSPPYHPYTEALLSAIPIADTSVHKKHIVLDGDIPSALNPPTGCPFQTRCPRKAQVPGNLCETEVPGQQDLGDGHQIKCHLTGDVFDSMDPVIVLGETETKTSGAGAKLATDAKSLAAAASAITMPKKAPAQQPPIASKANGVAAPSTVPSTTATPAAVPLSSARARAKAKPTKTEGAKTKAAATKTEKPKADSKAKSADTKKKSAAKAKPAAKAKAAKPSTAKATPAKKTTASKTKPATAKTTAAKSKAATSKTATAKTAASNKAKPKATAAKTKTTAKAKPAVKSAAKAKPVAKAKTSAAKAAPAKTAAKTKAPAKSAAKAKAPAKSAAKTATKAKAPAKTAAKSAVKSTVKSTTKTKAAAKPKAAAKKTTKAATKSVAKPAAKPKTKVAAKAKTKTAAKPAAKKEVYKGPAKVKKPKKPDDLGLIAGVGPKIEGILNKLGVYTYKQVAEWKKADRDWVNDQLSFKGRIEREDWVKQAKALAKGGEAEYIKVFGKKPR